MKTGILTFWKTEDNYGQLLQCYATQRFLQKLGHEAFLVRTSNGREYNPTTRDLLYSKLRTAYRLKKYPFYFLKRALGSILYTLIHGRLRRHSTNRGFERFRVENLNASKVYSLEELKRNPPEADAFIVGSDQIWNTNDGIYFLSWAPERVRKISLAASFGALDPSEEFIQTIRPWLTRFNCITVRENSGLEICSAAGRDDAILVPDPTLLLRADDYNAIMKPTATGKPYIFIYFLGTRTAIDWRQIHSFAREKGLDIIYVGSQGQEDKYKKKEPEIGEWLSLMAGADYVITNSFHGTVFALQFHRRFMVYPVCGASVRMNDRLFTLLNPLNLHCQIYNGSLAPLDNDIDYSAVFDKLDLLTASAKSVLSSALE